MGTVIRTRSSNVARLGYRICPRCVHRGPQYLRASSMSYGLVFLTSVHDALTFSKGSLVRCSKCEHESKVDPAEVKSLAVWLMLDFGAGASSLLVSRRMIETAFGREYLDQFEAWFDEHALPQFERPWADQIAMVESTYPKSLGLEPNDRDRLAAIYAVARIGGGIPFEYVYDYVRAWLYAESGASDSVRQLRRKLPWRTTNIATGVTLAEHSWKRDEELDDVLRLWLKESSTKFCLKEGRVYMRDELKAAI